MAQPAFIHGLGAVSAAGIGVEALKNAARANLPILSCCPAFHAEPWSEYPLGTIKRETWDQIASDFPKAAAAGAAELIALAAAAHALQQANNALDGLEPERIGIILSSTKAEIGRLEKAPDINAVTQQEAAACQPHTLAAALATHLRIFGPIQAVSLACASGLAAIQQAASILERDKADAMLVVGVDLLSTFIAAGFHSLRSMDPVGCRPFDCNRRGLSPGEAAAAILLTKSHTLAQPIGILKGCGLSNDANHLTGPSRDGSGLALAIGRALRMARLGPEQIAYVHAHGTGTQYNDAMECLALRAIFAEQIPPFASSKAICGHTMGAAGVLETVLVLACARAGFWPGTPGLKKPDPIAPDSLAAAPLPMRAHACFLKINSGFGGVNAALALETC